jgi:hypothetical protein
VSTARARRSRSTLVRRHDPRRCCALPGRFSGRFDTVSDGAPRGISR